MLTATLFLLLCGILSAQEAIVPPGDGTTDIPYRISMWEHLYWLSQNPSEWGKHFVQTTDIEFPESITTWDGDKGWTPIGTNTDLFTGHYDGKGHTITGLRHWSIWAYQKCDH